QGRGPRDRVPAADLRVVDAARPGDQQRVLLGDRPQPGRDVLPRLVYTDGPGRRRRVPLRVGAGLVRELQVLPPRPAPGGVRARGFDDDPAGDVDLPGPGRRQPGAGHRDPTP